MSWDFRKFVVDGRLPAAAPGDAFKTSILKESADFTGLGDAEAEPEESPEAEAEAEALNSEVALALSALFLDTGLHSK